MKKIIIAMAAVAAAFTTASCNKEQPVSANENPTVGKSVITASIENGLTKAHLDANGDDTDGYKVFWSEGDDLIVGGGLDEYGNYLNWVAEYKLEDSSAGSSKGTFSWQAGNTFISIDEICQEPSFEAGNMYMAVHPFDLIDMNTSAFTWRTEQTYNGTTGYIPMIAAAEGTEDGTADFKFTNLGGLLRLTVKGTATIKSITVKAKEPMSGEIDCFAMDEEGNIVALMGNDDRYETYNYINLDCGENGVALSSTGTDFYISMPCHYSVEDDDISLGGYSEVSIILTDTEERTCEKNLSSNKQLVIERSKITPATFTASEFKAPVPEGALPGIFSVAEGRKVKFARGNLWYQNGVLYNEDEQYQFSSDDWAKNGHISHFMWCKSQIESYQVSYYERDASSDDNLFTNTGDDHLSPNPDLIVNGQKGIWRVLSGGACGEWDYLLNSRATTYGSGKLSTDNHRYAEVKVNDMAGLLIFPDEFSWPTGAGTEPTIFNDAELDWNGVNYEGSAFEILQSAGCVFLPAAGFRDGEQSPGISPVAVCVHYVGNSGKYWSASSSDIDAADCLYFNNFDVITACGDNRYMAYSVRLVTDVK